MRAPWCCCACGDPYPLPPYNVLPNEAVICARCCDRIVSILRGLVLEHIEGWPKENLP